MIQGLSKFYIMVLSVFNFAECLFILSRIASLFLHYFVCNYVDRKSENENVASLLS